MVADLDADADPVSEAFHDNSWSANLEEPRHANDREAVVAEAIAAVERTGAGYHVNLVTHANHGHPESYLFERLATRFDDSVSIEYVDQCGCGGHVTKVTLAESASAR